MYIEHKLSSSVDFNKDVNYIYICFQRTHVLACSLYMFYLKNKTLASPFFFLFSYSSWTIHLTRNNRELIYINATLLNIRQHYKIYTHWNHDCKNNLKSIIYLFLYTCTCFLVIIKYATLINIYILASIFIILLCMQRWIIS